MDKPLTVDEAAEFLSVSRWTVLDYIYQGKLQAYKMGNGSSKRGNRRQWRIWKNDLVDFINKGKREH